MYVFDMAYESPFRTITVASVRLTSLAMSTKTDESELLSLELTLLRYLQKYIQIF